MPAIKFIILSSHNSGPLRLSGLMSDMRVYNFLEISLSFSPYFITGEIYGKNI